jgi:hypothetical protein
MQIDSLDRTTIVRYISDDEGKEFKDLEVVPTRK